MLSRFRSRNSHRNLDDDLEESPPKNPKGILSRFRSRNRSQDSGLGPPPPPTKKGATGMFGKLLGKGAKKIPETSQSEQYALDKVGQHIVEAAENRPDGAAALPKKKKGVIHAVDRLMVRIIAPEEKRRYEQHLDHGNRHDQPDDQSHERHSEDYDRPDDRSYGSQPSYRQYSIEERGMDEDPEPEREPEREPEHHPNDHPIVTRIPDQNPDQYIPRNRSQGHSSGYAPSHPANITRTAPPLTPKPTITSRSLVKADTGARKRPSQFEDPPSSPIQILCDSISGNTRGLDGCRHPTFQYSNCSGKKKAVCVGINYIGQKSGLHGCIDDAHDISKFLMRKYHYKAENVMVLTDDVSDEKRHPTRENMINAMQWLVAGAKPHDSLFFHYSGHGGQTTGGDVDREKGYDDVIFPVDYQQAGHITDRDLNKYLVRPLPQGCRLTSLFDSCHSGTVLDIPYHYHSNGRLAGKDISAHWRASKASSSDTISWCACKDDQVSADTQEHGEAVGAMSWAFRTALTRNPEQSYSQLLRSIRQILRNRYSQKSQLSSSHPMHMNVRFIM